MGGSSGTGGTGGTVSGTSGSGGKGGSSGKGGAGGSSGGSGSGGKGGAGPVCGNGVLEAGEVCDDGNTLFGDSCSPTCTNVCELCESDLCTLDYDFQSCDYLFAADAVATSGSGTGKKRRDLCKSLLTCYQRTACAKAPEKAIQDCYCGSATSGACAADLDAPKGACRDEIEAASEAGTNIYNSIYARINNGSYPLGAASQFYLRCDRGRCSNECVLGKPQTECQKCAGLYSPEAMGGCYANPSIDPTGVCSAAMACAHATRCALNGAASCYGVVANNVVTVPGPCMNEITPAAISGFDTPQQIASALSSGSAFTLAQELATEANFCQATCFPPPSGGAGGGGGGGSSGNGGRVNGGTGG
jgi:cysteine-rich repeat protein